MIRMSPGSDCPPLKALSIRTNKLGNYTLFKILIAYPSRRLADRPRTHEDLNSIAIYHPYHLLNPLILHFVPLGTHSPLRPSPNPSTLTLNLRIRIIDIDLKDVRVTRRY